MHGQNAVDEGAAPAERIPAVYPDVLQGAGVADAPYPAMASLSGSMPSRSIMRPMRSLGLALALK